MNSLVMLLLLLYLVLNKKQISNYTNYIDYTKPFLNCSNIHEQNFQKIKERSKTIQPFGYTPNEYLDKTRLIKTTEPLPVNPDFFM